MNLTLSGSDGYYYEKSVVTRQELHSNSGDLSSEAGGLQLTLQDEVKTAHLSALAEILQRLHTFDFDTSVNKVDFSGISFESGDGI